MKTLVHLQAVREKHESKVILYETIYQVVSDTLMKCIICYSAIRQGI
jgi:hypothetical protein